MTKKVYDYLVFIGRFQPFHSGHKYIIDEALAQASRVIVLCGSAYRPRTLRNPWVFAERKAMIEACYSAADNERMTVTPLLDSMYNDDIWVTNVQKTINGIVASEFQAVRPPKIGLIGHNKDESSYYLELFPQWSSVDVPKQGECDATGIREQLFTGGDLSESALDAAVLAQLQAYREGEDYTELRDEYEFIANYKKGWEAAPYMPD